MEQQRKAPSDIIRVAQFLRSSPSIRTRAGALNGKRIDYFKGRSAVKALLSPSFASLQNVPKVATEAEAIALLSALNAFAFFLRVQRSPAASGSPPSAPKTIALVPEQKFVSDDYYAWFFHGSQWRVYAGGALMVCVMLAGVMFPLWPSILRLGVWYLSIAMLGVIGLFFALAVIRLIFYVITVLLVSPGIWIFPQLFADVGFVDSFIPLWEWDLPKKKTKKRHGEKGKANAETKPDSSENGGTPRDESPAPDNRKPRVEEEEEEDA